LQERAAAEGIAPLLEELGKIDPDTAARLHPADEKRIIRALEVWYETGTTMTAHNAATLKRPPRYEALTIGLDFADRADLWSRIDLRVNAMLRDGLEDEVRSLLAAGVPMDATAMQAIGYKELAAAIGEDRPLDGAAEEVKLRSRQYAKRQRSWFRRNAAAKWIFWHSDPQFSEAVQNSTAYMVEFGLV
ncbi:MAG: tRNA dimethylallyltransferase, partial [Pseudoflavonifractor sp.]